MLRYLKNKWPYFLVILALMIAEPAVGSVLYLYLGRMYAEVQVGTATSFILRLLLSGVLIWVGKRLIAFAGGVLRNALICHVRGDMKEDIFSTLLSKTRAEQESGEYLSALTNDVTLMEQRCFEQLLSLIGNVFSIVILGGSFMSLDKTLGTAVLCFGLTVSLVPALFQRKMAEKSSDYAAALGKFTGRLKELITAFPTLKNFGAEEVARHRFRESNRMVEGRSFDASFALSLGNNVATTLSWFMQIICIGTGLLLVARGQILLPTLIAALAFAEDLAAPLGGIVSNINALLSVRGVSKEIMKLCEGEKEAAERGALPSGDIEFENMSLFAAGRYIVKDFSFTFEKGKKYLVLGPNGSGKTSVFWALKKRFERYEGSIRVSGKEVCQIPSRTLSGCVSYLCQPVLFGGTVRDNVSMFRPCRDGEYADAVRRAHLHLSEDHRVEENGKNLSCGERQRIELARSLLSGAETLILDESIANLDPLTAHQLEQELLDYEETVIHISHHPLASLMERYDEILIMENGRLTAHGSAKELTEKSAYFKELCGIAIGRGA